MLEECERVPYIRREFDRKCEAVGRTDTFYLFQWYIKVRVVTEGI